MEPVWVEQLWRCDGCGKSGSTFVLSNDDAESALKKAIEQHQRETPDCVRTNLRVPEGWSRYSGG